MKLVQYHEYLVSIVDTVVLGAVSIRKTVLPGMAIPMLKIRRPNGRLIFNMEKPYVDKTVFILRRGPGASVATVLSMNPCFFQLFKGQAK